MLNVYGSTVQKLVNIYQLFLHVIPLLIFQVKSCPELNQQAGLIDWKLQS